MVAQLDSDYCLTRPGRAWSRLLSYALFEGRPLTTRGRWINPLVERLLRRASSQQHTAVPAPVFVVGTGRSGTTLLGKLLSMHPDIGFLNEPKLMWNIAFPFEDLVGSYSADPAKLFLNAADADHDGGQRLTAMYSHYLNFTGNSRVLDKYPELVFRIPFVKAIFPDARFVFIVRRGENTCQSVSNWSRDHQTVDSDSATATDWWGLDNRKWQILVEQGVRNDPALQVRTQEISAFTRQSDMAAIEWILAMKTGLAEHSKAPESMHLLRYEDLTDNPRETLGGILDFCGLADDPLLLDFAERNCNPGTHHPALEIDSVIRHEFERVSGLLNYS